MPGAATHSRQKTKENLANPEILEGGVGQGQLLMGPDRPCVPRPIQPQTRKKKRGPDRARDVRPRHSLTAHPGWIFP